MRKGKFILALLLVIAFKNTNSSDRIQAIIFESKIVTDNIDDKRNRLIHRIVINRVVYTYDTAMNEFISKRHENITIKWESDGHVNKRRKEKKTFTKYYTSIPSDLLNSCINSIQIKDTSKNVYDGIKHTSHKKEVLTCSIIINSDTIIWKKLAPFNSNNVWRNFKDKLVHSGDCLDSLFYMKTPEKFLLKNRIPH